MAHENGGPTYADKVALATHREEVGSRKTGKIRECWLGLVVLGLLLEQRWLLADLLSAVAGGQVEQARNK